MHWRQFRRRGHSSCIRSRAIPALRAVVWRPDFALHPTGAVDRLNQDFGGLQKRTGVDRPLRWGRLLPLLNLPDSIEDVVGLLRRSRAMGFAEQHEGALEGPQGSFGIAQTLE